MPPVTAEPLLAFEDVGRALLDNALRQHPMLTPETRQWIEEACRRLGIEGGPIDSEATPERPQ